MKIREIKRDEYAFYQGYIAEGYGLYDSRILVSEDKNIVEGTACFAISEGTAMLQWLYVFEEYRGKGTAVKLIEEFEKIAKKEKCDTFAAMYPSEMDDVAAIDLMLACRGYIIDNSARYYYEVTKEELINSAIAGDAKEPKYKEKVKSIMALNPEDAFASLRKAIKNGHLTEEQADIREADVRKTKVMLEGGNIVGMLKVVPEEEAGTFALDTLYLEEEHWNEGVSFVREALRQVLSEAKDLRKLIFLCADDKMDKMAKQLLGNVGTKGVDVSRLAVKYM